MSGCLVVAWLGVLGWEGPGVGLGWSEFFVLYTFLASDYFWAGGEMEGNGRVVKGRGLGGRGGEIGGYWNGNESACVERRKGRRE